jgi:diacylglycerol O-acyltransferase
MPPTDSVFLAVEARQRPMHVGGLHLYRPPADAGPDYVRELYRRLTDVDQMAPLFLKRPARSLTTLGQWGWEEDRNFDIEHHVRLNALPRPGRILELLALVSRLHGTLLDRSRPLWEAYLIEGLDDGRFAVYFKAHHALLDGVSAARLLQSVLSVDPDDRDQPPPWARRPRPPVEGLEQPAADVVPVAGTVADGPVRSTVAVVRDAVGIPRAIAAAVRQGLRDEASPVSFAAPRTIFNVPITGARRFAAQSWSLPRLRAIGRATGTTLNDVVLAMCAGALRRYLHELGALPAAPLVAMVPVALTPRDVERESGNSVGAVMCSLGTHLDAAADRLAWVSRSMSEGKESLSTWTPLQIQAMTAVGLGPLLLQTVPFVQKLARPPFNLIISNVPGPRRPLYLNGARLDGVYPLSVPFDGQALNITCTSYASQLAFGLTGCRRSVPHLQRLLGHLDKSLGELEELSR